MQTTHNYIYVYIYIYAYIRTHTHTHAHNTYTHKIYINTHTHTQHIHMHKTHIYTGCCAGLGTVCKTCAGLGTIFNKRRELFIEMPIFIGISGIFEWKLWFIILLQNPYVDSVFKRFVRYCFQVVHQDVYDWFSFKYLFL